jgi:hypothetical protein
MKLYKTGILLLGILMVGIVFGIYTRSTYTDIQSQPGYEMDLMVGQLGSYALPTLEDAKEELPESSLILWVTPVDDLEYREGYGRQLVQIKQVCQGDSSLEGTTRYLASSSWYLSLGGVPDSIERGFVNFMKQGENYLVFATGEQPAAGGEIVIRMNDGMITPFVFAQKDDGARAIGEKTVEGTSYTCYANVSENELFADSEEVFEAWHELKMMLMEKYPLES